MRSDLVFMVMALYIFGAAPAAAFSRNDRELFTRLLLWPVFLVVLLASAAMNGFWLVTLIQLLMRKAGYVRKLIRRDLRRAERSAEQA